MSRYTLGADVALVTVGVGAVVLNKRSGVYWQANETAARLLSAVQRGEAIEDCIQQISREFHQPMAIVAEDISRLVESLTRSGLIKHVLGS